MNKVRHKGFWNGLSCNTCVVSSQIWIPIELIVYNQRAPFWHYFLRGTSSGGGGSSNQSPRKVVNKEATNVPHSVYGCTMHGSRPPIQHPSLSTAPSSQSVLYLSNEEEVWGTATWIRNMRFEFTTSNQEGKGNIRNSIMYRHKDVVTSHDR